MPHGTEKYISKDYFSCALTRYKKSPGLSFTPSLSLVPFSGPTQWPLVGSDSPHHGGQDSCMRSSCVLKFKAKEKIHASFLVIPAQFPIVTLTEPFYITCSSVKESLRTRGCGNLIGQAHFTQITLPRLQGVGPRAGKRRP